MKSPRERAIDIVWQMIGDGFSRGLFVEVLKDSGTTGTMAKKFVDAVERGIEQDRVDMQKARAPS